MRTFSFGGGVQSTAVLALQSMGELAEPFDVYLLADTGDEHPDTYDYLEAFHRPLAESCGAELHTLKRTWKDGSTYSILEHIDRLETALPIPVYMEGDDGRPGKPWQRRCTSDWKIEIIDRWLRKNGATADAPVECGMGISLDEIHRARPSRVDYKILTYPLLDAGITRAGCYEIINRAGLPPAPRSACFYCPFSSTERWRELRKDRPDLFQRAIELEEELSARTQARFGTRVFLSRKGRLADLDDQLAFPFDLDEPDSCDSGHCFT